ncbi:hypothetical protein, partial [Enterococcus faecium]|uniref:hypothetical protein n=1 Tax=Enterococcus faecium TaxID=1352 RepID=UPI0029310234
TGHLRVRRYLTYCTPPPLRFKGKRGKKHEKKLMQLCCAANNFYKLTCIDRTADVYFQKCFLVDNG